MAKASAKSRPLHIGVDLMGSESTPEKIFEAVQLVATELGSQVKWTLFGLKKKITLPMQNRGCLRVVPCASFIAMDEDPLQAIRRKIDSTLVQGMISLASGDVDVFISAGNTGSLIGASALMLSPFPTVARPSLLALLPSKKDLFCLIDVGAQVKMSTAQLVQNARLGASFFRQFFCVSKPRVGLLNVGVESKKGTTELQEAYHHLSHLKGIAFKGNIEGREVFDGNVDVVVTGGLAGNILLKSAEGLSSYFLYALKKILQTSGQKEILDNIQKRFNYTEYPGALVCGVEGMVLKCHGEASFPAIINCLRGAYEWSKVDLIAKMKADF